MTTHTVSHHVGYILRLIWDPIGLDAGGFADEYDSYVPHLVALLDHMTVSEPEFIAHLARIETEMMGLALSPVRRTRAARALLGLREACGRPADTLVAQWVSHDGLRCLWLFDRPDGLHTYQHAALEAVTDENGSWSWWNDVGTGRSGLFPTNEAAERDARATIGWLRDEGSTRCP